MGEVASAISKQWREASEEERNEYNILRDNDKIRYQNQLEELEETGMFTLEDGRSSTDESVRKSRRK